jgi:hypothetical protein
MILRHHAQYYEEILSIPGFLQDPILTFGYQGIDQDAPPGSNPPRQRLRRFLVSEGKLRRIASFVKSIVKPYPRMPAGFQYRSLSDLLRARGNSVVSLDLFDSRAELRYDMNQPVPESEYKKYGTLIDIGCLEHLFDTAQVLENCMRMVRCGGHYLLHTPVNGHFGHGLHVFNPQGLIDCFGANGFKIVYLKYSTGLGKPVSNPSISSDVILWMIGRKEQDVPAFICPQQEIWRNYANYAPQPRPFVSDC